MTEEERKKQAKKAKEFGEKAKIAIRNIRREANDEIKKMFKNKVITEDDQKRGLDKVQEITDSFVAKVDEIVNKKIDDVMKV
jgi:ribosome recycling factor